jgi:hypothetical protein
VKEAVRNVTNWLTDRGKALRPKVPTILPSGYWPELDATPYCDEEESDYYQQQVGVLRWAVELGQFNITAGTSMLEFFTAAPRTGHLLALFHILLYHKCYSRSKLVFDDSYISLDDEEDFDWNGFIQTSLRNFPPSHRNQVVSRVC